MTKPKPNKKTWREFFQNDVPQSQFERQLQQFDASIQHSDNDDASVASLVMHLLMDFSELQFLCVEIRDNSRVQLLHHFTELDCASSHNSHCKNVCLRGHDARAQTLIYDDAELLCTTVSQFRKVPKLHDLLQCRDKADVILTACSDDLQLQCRPIIPLPPFVSNAIMDLGSNNLCAAEMLVLCAQLLRERDRSGIVNVNVSEQMCYILQFLWLVAQCQIPSPKSLQLVPTAMDMTAAGSNSINLEHWSNDLHAKLHGISAQEEHQQHEHDTMQQLVESRKKGDMRQTEFITRSCLLELDELLADVALVTATEVSSITPDSHDVNQHELEYQGAPAQHGVEVVISDKQAARSISEVTCDLGDDLNRGDMAATGGMSENLNGISGGIKSDGDIIQYETIVNYASGNVIRHETIVVAPTPTPAPAPTPTPAPAPAVPAPMAPADIESARIMRAAIKRTSSIEEAERDRDQKIVVKNGNAIIDQLARVGKGKTNERKQIDVAIDHMASRDYSVAVNILNGVLKHMRSKYHQKDAKIAICVYDLIADLYFLQKKYEKALNIYSDILDLDKKVAPAKFRAVQKKEAKTVQRITENKTQKLFDSADENLDLGIVNMKIGTYDKATECFTKALGTMQMTYGPSHQNVTIVREHLADSFIMQAKYDDAKKAYEGILATFARIKVDPNDHRFISVTKKLKYVKQKIIEERRPKDSFKKIAQWMTVT